MRRPRASPRRIPQPCLSGHPDIHDRVRRHQGLQRRYSPLRHDLTVVDDRDMLAEPLRLVYVVRREEDRGPGLVVEYLLPKDLTVGRIKAGGRLIQNRIFGVCIIARDLQALSHTAGIGRDIVILTVYETEALQVLVCLLTGFLHVHPEVTSVRRKVLMGSQPTLCCATTPISACALTESPITEWPSE